MTVDKEIFDRLISAKNVIDGLMNLEQAFRVYVASVREFEAYLLLASVDYLTDWSDENESMAHLYDSGDRKNADINFRALSILTASGAYHDQRRGWKSRAEFPVGIFANIEEAFSYEFRKYPSYRIVEVLRNHAKHQSVAVNRISFGDTKQYQDHGTQGALRLRNTIDPQIRVADLIENHHLRGETRDQMKEIDEEYICMKSLFRNYLSSMARGHEKVRMETESFLTDAIAEIDSAHGLFLKSVCAEDDKPISFLCAVSIDREIEEKFNIDPLFYEKLIRARKRFERLQNYRRSYVSSEMVKIKDVHYCDVDDILRN